MGTPWSWMWLAGCGTGLTSIGSMARVFITGSADGLGLELGRQLQARGREVVLHGRSADRAAQAAAAVPGAHGTVAGDLASVRETKQLAGQAHELGPFDAVVHNAGVGFRGGREVTEDGVEHVFAVNVLAPYVLTGLLPAPRLIYLSSGLHHRGDPDLEDLSWEGRPWNPMQAYCDSKLLDVALAFAVARRWPEVISDAVEPGWIATKMGGSGAPGTLEEGVQTQLWLLRSGAPEAQQSGQLFSHCAPTPANPRAHDAALQEELLDVCQRVSGVSLPDAVTAR
jgi:NAD(P)-dependent dehydrogenase (short-subunit alcohol dehydrogenase family)